MKLVSSVLNSFRDSNIRLGSIRLNVIRLDVESISRYFKLKLPNSYSKYECGLFEDGTLINPLLFSEFKQFYKYS